MARLIISAIVLFHLATFCVSMPGPYSGNGSFKTDLGVISEVVEKLSGHSTLDKVDLTGAVGAGVDQLETADAGVDQSDAADNEDDQSESGDEEDGSLDEEEVFGDEDADPEDSESNVDENAADDDADDYDDDDYTDDFFVSNIDLSVGDMHLSRPYPVAPGRPYPGVPNGPYQYPSQRPTAVCRARYSYHPEKADWEAARLICEMEGGQLATITGEASQGRIGSRFGSMPEFWIGATDIEREGQFRWINGQGLGFARWYSSQPNKKYPNNEHCVTFNYWGKDTKWGDRNCYDSRPFLCETTVCTPSVRRFPGGYPNQFRGPLRNPFQFPRNQNFPGPQGLGGIATHNWPRGRGFPYDRYQDIRAPINLG